MKKILEKVWKFGKVFHTFAVPKKKRVMKQQKSCAVFLAVEFGNEEVVIVKKKSSLKLGREIRAVYSAK